MFNLFKCFNISFKVGILIFIKWKLCVCLEIVWGIVICKLLVIVNLKFKVIEKVFWKLG